MNNKGFAITGILYGLMIMFILILLSFLTVLSSKKNRLETITNSISEELEYNTCTDKNVIINATDSDNIVISNNGLYYFKINNNSTECSVYLPQDSYIFIEDNKLKINKNNTSSILTLSNCTNSGISSITITKVCE